MADAKIVLSAVDQTKAAFDSAQAGLKGLQVSAASVTSTLGALGVAAAAMGFAARIKGVIDAADEINKLSQRTGVATEALSQLQFAAKLSDVSAESLTTAIKKLNVSIAEGLGGDKAKVEMFKNLGISLSDASGQAKTADKVMLDMADTFSKSKDGAVKTAYAVGLMGKAGDELIPLLNGGSAAIVDMMRKADKLGLTMGPEFTQRAEEFNDNLFILRKSGDKLAMTMGSDLVAGLGKTMKAMADAAIEGGKFAGIIAGIQTLLTGDDRHKNNVQLVEDTDSLLRAENALLAARASGMNAAGIAAREKWVADLRERIKLTQSYGKVLDEVDAKAAKAEADKPKKDGNLKPLSNVSEAAAELKKYEAAVKSLSDKLGTLENQSESEKLAFELYGKSVTMADGTVVHLAGSLEKLTPAHKRVLPIIAAEVDARKNIQTVLKAEIEFRTTLEAVMLRGQAITTGMVTAGKDQLDQYKFETDLIGKTADQIVLLNAQRQIDLNYKQRLKALGDVYVEGGAGLDAEIAKLDKATQALRNGLIPEIVKRNELERAWATGSIAAYNEYVDNATNAARQAHDAWSTAFKGMEDLLANFLMTGKLDFKSFVTSIEQQLAHLAAQQFVVNIVGNVSGTGSGGSGGAGGNLIGNLGSSFISKGATSLFGSGNMSAATSFATGNMSLANLTGSIGANAAGTGIDGLLASNAAFGTAASAEGGAALAAGVGAEAGAAAGATAATGALAAIPVAGWIALAALAIYSVVSKSGETRVGGQYRNGALIDRPSGGEIQGDATRTAIVATMGTINAELKALGSSDKLFNFVSGLEESKNGKGFAFAGGQLASGATFGQGTDGQGFQNRRGSMTSEEAAAAFSEELKQATLQALQAANVPGILGDYLRQLGDVDKLSGGALDAAIGRINKALTEKQQLEDKLYDLTATDLEKLNKQRDAERAAVDESNRALLEQVYAQEDLKSASDATTQAIDRARASSQNALQGVDKAFGVLQKSVGAERARLDAEYQAAIAPVQERISQITDSVNKLASLSGVLRSSLNGFATNTTLGLQRSDASAQIAQALALAKSTGQLPDQDSLQNALSVVAQPSEQLYGSFVDYAKAFDGQVSTISDLDSLTEGQLSTQKRELAAAEGTLKSLTNYHSDSLAALDGILAASQGQIDALNGGLLSIAQALALFKNATNVAATVTGGGGGGGVPQLSSTGLHDLFNGALGLDSNPNATFDQIYQVAYANKDVLSLSSLAAAYPNLDVSAVQAALDARGLPSFDVGIASVPYDMPANIHRGERILTNSENAALTRAVELMAARMEELCFKMDAQVTHSFYMRKRIEEFSTIGMPVKNAPSPDNVLTTSV